MTALVDAEKDPQRLRHRCAPPCGTDSMRCRAGRFASAMFIERIAIGGFGRLRGEWTFERGKVNLLCGDNEQGKTTLADAILYSFYGFPVARGHALGAQVVR